MRTILHAERLTYGLLAVRDTLYRTYDTVYGIYDHSGGGNHPLSSVMFHPGESSGGRTKLMDRIDLFDDLQIHRTWGLNLTEFLKLPRDMVQYLIKRTEENNVRKANMNPLNDLEKELDQEL